MRKHTRPRTRTEPSARGVASVTARVARPPRANGAARPQDVAATPDKREGPVRTAEAPKCASTPRVVCAFQYGSKWGFGLPSNPTPANRTSCPAPRPCSARTPWGYMDRLPRRNRASWLGRRRASRSVSTVGRPFGRTIHGKHYGVGGDSSFNGLQAADVTDDDPDPASDDRPPGLASDPVLAGSQHTLYPLRVFRVRSKDSNNSGRLPGRE